MPERRKLARSIGPFVWLGLFSSLIGCNTNPAQLTATNTGTGSDAGATDVASDATADEPPDADFSWQRFQIAQGNDIDGLWGSSTEDVWAASSSYVTGGLYHSNGSGWSIAGTGSPKPLSAIWGSGASDVWAGGDGALLHWNGTNWTASVVPTSGGTTNVPVSISALWGSGKADVWAVGTDTLHWDGTIWSNVLPGTGASGLWGSGANDVWSVGGSVIRHWDGTAWTTAFTAQLFGEDAGASMGGAGFNAVWGSGPNDVYAVGLSGLVAQWNGTSWSKLQLPNASLRAIWGSGATDIWTAGERPTPATIPEASGVIIHYDGRSWTPASRSPIDRIDALWGCGTIVWASGVNGTFLRHQE
jgi:hypothetical protein